MRSSRSCARLLRGQAGPSESASGSVFPDAVHRLDSVKTLVADIEDYLADRNLTPKPYKWKAKGEAILRKVQHARASLAAQQDTTGHDRLTNPICRTAH